MIAVSPNITEKTDIDDTLLISANDIGDWLRLNSNAVSADQDIIESLIKTAIEQIEQYSWLTLRRTTYLSYFYFSESIFCSFLNSDIRLNLERSPILSLDDITKIEYLDENNLWVEFSRGTKTVEGLYENTTEKKEQRRWASIYFKETIPYEKRYNAYKIRVTFKAGWDSEASEEHLKIPESLKLAIKQIVSFYYVNRGDCFSECSLNGYMIPCQAKSIIDMFAISKTILGGSYNPTYQGGLC